MTPRPPIYIYTYGDCTGLFWNIKKNAHFYKDCRGFWTKKNAHLEPKINFLTTFLAPKSMDLTSNRLWQWFGPSKPCFELKLIKNDQKWPKTTPKNHFLTPFFNFPGSPPWKMQKIDFPIWNLHLKWQKLPEVLVVLEVFFIFDPKTMVLTIFDPKNHFLTPKPSKTTENRCHNPAPTTTLCLAMFFGLIKSIGREMATRFSTTTNMKST